jgi:FAD/FMN-containing dehydrogenase
MLDSYEEKKARLSQQMRIADNVRLGKETSNLFRDREKTPQNTLSVRDFSHVLSINSDERWAEVEGMTTYEELVNETLKYGFMPAVVPQLKTITIGGAVSGVGIESSSFRYGLVHETVLEMEIMLASGETTVCNKEKNTDLFYGFPNSYGTFGYALRLKIRLIPVKPFVKLEHIKYNDAVSYFAALKNICEVRDEDNAIDFVDGVMFGANEMYISKGKFLDEAPFTSDYTYKNIYYRSIQNKKEDYLCVRDYIWRWDTDWFWCSKVIYGQNPLVRQLLGSKRLNSKFYTKLMRWDHRWRFSERLYRLFGIHGEWVIQDVDIPIENAPQFARFFSQEIRIKPVWICPIGAYNTSAKFTLYPLDSEKLYINFGFWDAVPTKKEQGYYNRLIEEKVSELHGKKSLYSDSFYTQEQFWNIYDKQTYEALKQKYDPQKKLKTLFEKAVKKA